MKESIDKYIKKIDDILKKSQKIDYQKLKEEHLDKIKFYQHERLIHLLVTLFYVIFLLSTIALSYFNSLFLIIFFILLVFLIFYIKHYFYLENHVQHLYKQYDDIIDRID